MSQDLRTLELFSEANPVPDEQAIESPPIEATAYLATLQQRSSDVVQLDERTEVKDKKRSWMIAAAAAVIVVLGAVVFILTQSSEDPPVATQPPADAGELEGYWSGEEADFFFGESEYAIVIDGALSDSGIYETGVREGDNRILILTSGEETADCTPGDVAIVNYDFVLGGATVQLSGTPTDECGLRSLLDVELLTPTDPFVIPDPAAAADPADLSGSWSADNTAVVFGGNTYAIVQNDVLVDQGTFALEPGQSLMTFASASNSPGCAPDAAGQMGFKVGSGLSLLAIDDPCIVRSFLSSQGPTLELEPVPDIEIELLDTEIDVSGEWVDGSVEVELADSSYEIRLDGVVIDAGEYRLASGPYRLELASSSGDASCISGTYEIALEGGINLALRPTSEQCPARNALSDAILQRKGIQG